MRRAIGFILRPESGENVSRHANEMEREATQLGFSWIATFYADLRAEANYIRMISRLIREDADAVFLPSAVHLDERDIQVLATHTDVYCLGERLRHTVHREDDAGAESSRRVVAMDSGTAS